MNSQTMNSQTMNSQTMNSQTMKRRMFHGIRFAAFGIVAVIVMGLVASGLWNVLATSIFGLRAITFWEALGLMLLSRILLGGRHGFGRGGGRRHGKFVTRWDHLNPEEKAHFRKAMGEAGVSDCDIEKGRTPGGSAPSENSLC
jgi:hypothetical protein